MKYSYKLLFFLLLLLVSCNDKAEENDGWEICTECDLDSWLGLFSGTASHYTATSNTTLQGKAIDIEIEETGSEYFTVYVRIPQQNYYATLSGNFVQPYAIDFASSTKSINATMLVKGDQLRLSGNSKSFQVNSDTTFIKEVVSFDILK
jgi:hypothetical protein